MMSTEVALQRAEQPLSRYAKDADKPDPNRPDVSLEASDLVAAATALRGARWEYLATLTGVDLGKEANQIEALYRLCDSVRGTPSPPCG
jgi:hypothetical protein